MYCRMTSFKSDPDTRSAGLEYIDSMMPKLTSLGALQLHWVEWAPGDWTLVALYPSKEAADAALEQANRNMQNAAAANVMIPSSVQRREGAIARSFGVPGA